MGILSIFGLLLLFSSGYCNDLHLGYPDPTSRLIYTKVHQENPALWVRSDTFTVNCSGNEVINAIRVLDLRQDKWGDAYIKGGGIGQKFVTIELDSPSIFRGFNFLVEVYAIRTNHFMMGYGNNMGLQEFEKWSKQPDLFSDKSRMCIRLRGLTRGQRRICRRHKDHMPVVGAGVRKGIDECQYQFKKRRWNCTVTADETVFGPLTLIASRETAFTHAITAAGVSLTVSRACRDGRLSSCSCSRAAKPRNLHSDWVWGGCGDNLEYGYKFTEGFVDVREREGKVKRGSREQGRRLMNRHNNEAGRRNKGKVCTENQRCVGCNPTQQQAQCKPCLLIMQRTNFQIPNTIHNYVINAVMAKSRVTCKCHGVSGSCSLITCWQQVASFREVGDYLKDKYEGATEVKVSRRGKLRIGNPHFSLPTARDLVYLEESPNYCIRNETLGSLGTVGRECNRTSSGIDSCTLMCCGRGYNTKRQIVKERCGCKFHWCCHVECNTCVRTVEVYTCK